MDDIVKAIGKLSGVLLAVTLAFYFLLNILPGFAKEIIHSDLPGREFMVCALILLMFVIVVIWGYAIFHFVRREALPNRSATSTAFPPNSPEHKTTEEEIKKMSEI